MINTVPFLYVNLTAICCYALILVTFLAVRKTAGIKAFIFVILGFFLWTAGTVLMRLQVFPGVNFWYYVSILSLFSLGVLLYFFVCVFAGVKSPVLKTLWTIGTVILLIITATGRVLQPPLVQTLPGGGTVFTYEVSPAVLIPYVFLGCVVVSIFAVFAKVIRERGIRTRGIPEIVLGCVTVAVGNMVQLIPGNVFPWDTLSGILFAVLLIFALYKRRMFRMTPIISRSMLMISCSAVCLLSAVYFISPLNQMLENTFGFSPDAAVVILVVAFTAFMFALYTLIKKLLDSMFTRDELQGKLLQDFSSRISKTLDTGEIMQMLGDVIKQEIHPGKIYICLPSEGEFLSRYNSSSLDKIQFSLSAGNPLITMLSTSERYILLSEFQKSPMYRSMWETEKNLFRALEINCVAALKDGSEVVGLLMLTKKEKGASYSNSELGFLDTVSAIASIAMKNAALYERVYREARIDSLTGVYNYKYFIEKTQEAFDAWGAECLALIFFDLDDLKLYNQLYGTVQGDKALRAVAEIIVSGTSAENVFRYSSKVFAALMPNFDGRESYALAQKVQDEVAVVTGSASGRGNIKALTLSCGICVSPHAASNAKELVENADLAVYNAKQNGKSRIVLFKGREPAKMSVGLARRAMEIVENADIEGGSLYETYSSTILALTAAIDAKDHYTYNHSRNVARYSVILATAIGVNNSQIRILYEAALLHDIGKISIPEVILSKESALTPEEHGVMREHVNNSIEMIRHLPSMDYVIPAAVAHHERWDGKGYPLGLKGEEIPLLARCLALADAFDAMTTDRPYRNGISFEQAARRIEDQSGTQFDPELARVFVGLVRGGEITLQDTEIEAG